MTDLKKSFEVATHNWHKWQRVFEHGPDARNPLLACPQCFSEFLKEYSVGRTIRAGTKRKLWHLLSTRGFLSELSGEDGIDRLDAELRGRFGTLDGRRGIVSALSKIAAFLKPETFIAWDSFATKGACKLLNRRGNFGSYAEYLSACDELWRGKTGNMIRSYAKRHALKSEERFLRRVLDVYLMQNGGRQFPHL